MVFDLEQLKSHPEKLLKTHIEGVSQKADARYASVLTKYASLFHDLGKINPNFQSKLLGEYTTDYSQHSYISAFAFLNWYVSNRDVANKLLEISDKNNLIPLKIIAAIVLHHHDNLPNLDKNVSSQVFQEMMLLLDKNADTLPISDFLKTQLHFEHSFFDLKIKPWYKNNIPNLDLGLNGNEHEIRYWRQDALSYFLDTQFAFASVIEADKRDASNNDEYNFRNKIADNTACLDNGLESLFTSFAKAGLISHLDKTRTAIREEAVLSIVGLLKTSQRVFSLTAPTGSGKTFTLFDIAREIQKQKGDLGIIFALPFLSVTEQAQTIVKDTLGVDVLSVNSKSFNERLEKAQKRYETEQTKESLKALLVEDFAENTFDHPLIITTFVQLFETFLSNRNSTLLKLPNFANRIFLIDEIQALPPRLYIFFTAWLDAFCKKNNSYAILSTATMPYLHISEKKELASIESFNNISPKLFFKNYQPPIELLKSDKYFSKDVFNRYVVHMIEEEQTIETISEKIVEEEKSVLVILNTIQDTKDLYSKLSHLPNVFLMNTHFTPEDRLQKIEEVKLLLKKQKVILVSTQLLEAGVDIDFPIVYRDLCPLPSLIQSAGRCNRNKKELLGNVYFFRLINNRGKYSSELVYRSDAKIFLDFIKSRITGQIEEKEFFEIQKDFFYSITQNLEIGSYPEGSMNLIKEINKAQFESVGKFQLINDKSFGTQYQFYVPKDLDDKNFENLSNLVREFSDTDYEQMIKTKIAIRSQLKRMSNRVISVRVFDKSNLPPLAHPEAVCGLLKLGLSNYDRQLGYKSNREDVFL